jgi:hypothetical protein
MPLIAAGKRTSREVRIVPGAVISPPALGKRKDQFALIDSLRSIEDLKSEETIDTPHVVLALEFDDPPLPFPFCPFQ